MCFGHETLRHGFLINGGVVFFINMICPNFFREGVVSACSLNKRVLHNLGALI